MFVQDYLLACEISTIRTLALFNIVIDCIFSYYYPYRAFGDQNKIVYSMRFVTRRAISF